jgi:hypothetical protein
MTKHSNNITSSLESLKFHLKLKMIVTFPQSINIKSSLGRLKFHLKLKDYIDLALSCLPLLIDLWTYVSIIVSLIQ